MDNFGNKYPTKLDVPVKKKEAKIIHYIEIQ